MRLCNVLKPSACEVAHGLTELDAIASACRKKLSS